MKKPNLLRIKTINATWCDKDTVMLHACFQILKDFIEKENGDNHCDYKHHKKFVDEVRFLYKWWMNRNSDDLFPDDAEDKDNKMLVRLMKIRLQLWT